MSGRGVVFSKVMAMDRTKRMRVWLWMLFSTGSGLSISRIGRSEGGMLIGIQRGRRGSRLVRLRKGGEGLLWMMRRLRMDLLAMV